MLKTLALIPARGGSKGIPRKNCRLLAGKPLIAWSIEAALASPYIDSVVVSTDDQEIADISRQYGAQVPFMRPSELAQDDSPGMAPVLHALEQLPQFDHILLLQPTSPLRTLGEVNRCIEFAVARQAKAVVSVNESAQSPYWMYRLDVDSYLSQLIPSSEFTSRQQLPPVFSLNGALYFANCEWLKKTQTFLTHETLGFVMPIEQSLDIDTPFDWKIAELLLADTL